MTTDFAISILKQYRAKPTLINEIQTVEEAIWLDEALGMAIDVLMAVQERETTKEVKHMSLKAGYKGIKETGEGINLDQEGSLSLDPDLNNILCKEETAGREPVQSK